LLETVLHRPRKLWARKALFQIHLWLGVLLSLYVVVIGLSGSILVFQDEIRLASLPHVQLDQTHVAPLSAVVARAHERFPASRLTFVGFPQMQNPWWTLYLENPQGKRHIVYADAESGTPVPRARRLFIDFVLDLHVYLLVGQTGFVVNCVAGIGLLALAITGAILWWPGIKLWRRALTVSLRLGWRRINYDLHNAVGIGTLVIVSWWGITAVYFLFPVKVAALVNFISPIVAMKSPAAPEPAPAAPSRAAVASLDAIARSLPAAASNGLSGVALPDRPGGEVTVYVDRAKPGDFSHRDIFTFDGHTGKLLTVWHYGDNKSLGDWVLWLMYPLHFGTLWGFGVKVLWALLGLALSLLSMTGLLMYWNRKLRTLIMSPR
jgi:uncharacterized iron-regulated membrane protein